MPAPVLIIGQGLAGTAIAWQLWHRGIPFRIVDPNLEVTCSKIAAGLVTPITGMRLNLSWRVADLIPEAESFYRRLETLLGTKFYHEVPHTRLFREQREVDLWQKRRMDPAVQAWVASESDLANPDLLRHELGGFQMRGSGWLHSGLYLESSRQFFIEHQVWQQGTVSESDLAIHDSYIVWQDAEYSHAIFCQGWEASNSKWFPELPFAAARGVIVDMETPQHRVGPRHIYNRSGWMLPKGDLDWRAGSTYEFDFDVPMEASLEILHAKLSTLLCVPFVMRNPRAGIRPIIKRYQAVLGRHPVHSRLAIFNGLGSKGAMKSPTLSRQLIAHLFDQQPLDPALDVCSNV